MTFRRGLLLAWFVSAPLISADRIIGGLEVAASDFPDIVRIKMDNAACSAVLVGPRVILTAAHCAGAGQVAKFEMGGKPYSAKLVKSPLYPGKDHDIALGLLDRATDVEPSTIGGKAEKGAELELYGYGCTKQGGGGGNDGTLRFGESEVVDFAGFDFVAKAEKGAALCFGDSGGPAYVENEDGSWSVVGVASKGNIIDTSYFARLDNDESRAFLEEFVKANDVEICGVNLECER